VLPEDRVVSLQKVLLVGIQEITPIAKAPAVFHGVEDRSGTGWWERCYWRLFFLVLGWPAPLGYRKRTRMRLLP
jgi:hypothetical protein